MNKNNKYDHENYVFQEYPKWIKTIDNRAIIVNNKDEEKQHTKKEEVTIKEEVKNEPVKDNSQGVDKKKPNVGGSNRGGRKSKRDGSE